MPGNHSLADCNFPRTFVFFGDFPAALAVLRTSNCRGLSYRADCKLLGILATVAICRTRYPMKKLRFVFASFSCKKVNKICIFLQIVTLCVFSYKSADLACWGLPGRILRKTFWLSTGLFESPELYWSIDELC